MNLVGKLKEQVENADNIEEAKKAIFDAGMELNDEEMEQLTGGCSSSLSRARFSVKCENCGLEWHKRIDKCTCGCTSFKPQDPRI